LNDVSTMPRWFWLLPALAAALWWPVAPYFASDDFIAVAYAQGLGAVADDFVGPQYGATDVWSFYRPLITLSFWIDQALGGPSPPTGHISNVFAHATSALLVASIWRRFLPAAQAFGAGLLWAMMPSHVGSIAWVVGRVDSHTTVWCLLAIWLCLRNVEGRGPRWATTAATAGALMSKELALVVPALCWWVALLRQDGDLRARTAAATRATKPAWLVLVLYCLLRVVALGGVGGYEASAFEPVDAARGLGSIVLDLLVPLRWVGGPRSLGSDLDGVFVWAALVPIMIAAFASFAARPRVAIGALVAWGVALVPMAPFLAACHNPHNLRYQYLPSVLLAGALAAGTAVQLHFGVDRMLQPPFCDDRAALRAWRPLLQRPDSVRLSAADGGAFDLGVGSSWRLGADEALHPAPPPAELPELVVTGDRAGVFDLTTKVLDGMLAEHSTRIASGAAGPSLTMPGTTANGFRVTIFTANGYLSCWCPNHARPGAPDARLDFSRFFGGDAQHPFWKQPAMVTTSLDADIGGALVVPTTIDLDPSFPALIEAGSFDLQQRRFEPTHRARRLINLRFDRGYPGWVRRCKGI
jgi:hypothetical protein